jgi:hypothetical protein
MRSVCFFMVYHARPALTKMALDDMQGAMQFFSYDGHDVVGLAIGGSYDVAQFCASRGIQHEMFANDPVSNKFSYAWLRAIQMGCDYIAWWGSNNVHGAGYLVQCAGVLEGKKVATFGTKNCVIMSAMPGEEDTCVFTPRDHYLISSGQFFLTHSLRHSVNPLTIYDSDQTFNFDGKVIDAMVDKWGEDIILDVSFDEEDCIDIKNGVNIHSYSSYMEVAGYPRYLSREVIRHRHPSLDLYLDGHFG